MYNFFLCVQTVLYIVSMKNRREEKRRDKIKRKKARKEGKKAA
jgi:hypothetical protein